MMRKRIDLCKAHNRTSECVEALEWLRGEEAKNLYTEDLLPNCISILKEEYEILAPIEASLIAKEIESGRMRLGADSLDRLVDRIHVHNFTAQLTGILRELSKEEPVAYLETFCKRLFRIVLSDYCNNESFREELSTELLALSLVEESVKLSETLQCIRFNVFGDEITDDCNSGPRSILKRFSLLSPDASEESLKLFDELEVAAKSWQRAFKREFSSVDLLREAAKYRIRALTGLKSYEEALVVMEKSGITDDEALDDFLFESVLESFESCGLLSRVVELIEGKLALQGSYNVLKIRLVDNLILLKRFSEAQTILEGFCDDDDFDLSARVSFNLGLCAWLKGFRGKQEVLLHFLAAAKKDSSVGRYFSWIGRYYWRVEGDGERAGKCLLKALNLDPTDLSSALLLSEIYLLSCETDGAERISTANHMDKPEFCVNLLQPFTRISSQTRNRRLFYYYGVALSLGGQFVEASVAFQSALKGHLMVEATDQDLPAVSDANCLQWIGESFLRSKRFGSASRAFSRLLKESESDAKMTGSVGLAAVHLQSRAPIEAVDCLTGIDCSSSSDCKVLLDLSISYVSLARSYFSQGRFISAAQSILKCIECAGAFPERLRICSDALCLADSLKTCLGFPEKEILEAYAKLTTFISSSCPVNPGLEPVLKRLQTVRGDEKKRFLVGAIELALSALSGANSALVSVHWLQLAAALAKVETFADLAISAASQIIETDADASDCKNSNSTVRAHAHHLLALLYNSQNNKPLAQHHFCRALKLSHENNHIWIDLGRFYFQAGDWELAGEAFKKALEADPEDLVAAFELAQLPGTLEAKQLAAQVALRAFTTQPVHFTEQFAKALQSFVVKSEESSDSTATENIDIITSDTVNTTVETVKEFAQVYLNRWNFIEYPVKFNDHDASELHSLSPLDRLNYLNERQDPQLWLSPSAQIFDCEFLLKRPQNDVAQSGWRAVVGGLLPEARERTKAEEMALR